MTICRPAIGKPRSGRAVAQPSLSRATSAILRASGRRSRSHGIDSVMHFAAWLSVPDSVRDPAGYYRNNVLGALSVLDAMIATGTKHFVFSSTCAVFGNAMETPIAEDHPRRPINAYGESKLAIERALAALRAGLWPDVDCAAIFQRGRRRSRRRTRGTSRPGDPCDSPRHRRGLRPGHIPGVRRGLRHARTARVSAITST